MRGRIPAALAAGVLFAVSAAWGASFDEEAIDPAPPANPWMKGIGDLDGDGRLDLVIAGREGPLVWYENPDWTRRTIASNTGPASSSTGIAIGDLDGNGSPDVVLANGAWFANPRPAGNAKTDSWERGDIDATQGHDVWLSDLDGDGDLDVVKRNQARSGEVIRVFRQGDGGTWTDRNLTAETGEGLALGDLDRDGDDDIVMRGRWFENDGDPIGGDWTAHPYTTAYTHPETQVKVADVNGDQRLDVVLAPSEFEGDSYRISWFEAPGNPEASGWTEHVIEPSQETVVHALVPADFDRDGRLDLAIAEMHQGADPDRVRVLFQKSAGSFSNEDLSGLGSHSMVTGDLDGDGRLDLFGANHNEQAADGAPAKVWWNRTSGGGGGGGGSPDALCAKRILREAGRSCRRTVRCHALALARPESDVPACVSGADAKLAEALAALPAKSPECVEEAAAATLASPAARDAGEAAVADVLAGADSTSKPGRQLQATLLRSLGGFCQAALDGRGRDAPAAAQSSDPLAAARERFLRKSGKALDRATDRGVPYSGPLPPALADAIDALATAFVDSLTPDAPQESIAP